jgi:hypothetical protein
MIIPRGKCRGMGSHWPRKNKALLGVTIQFVWDFGKGRKRKEKNKK